MRFPEIDYALHPAYARVNQDTSYDNAFLLGKIQAIDAIYQNFTTLKSPQEADCKDALADIGTQFDLIMNHAIDNGILILAEEWMDGVIDWVKKDLAYEFVRHIFSVKEHRSADLHEQQKAQLEVLMNKGMYVTDIPRSIYADIRELAMEHMETLRQRALSDWNNRSVIPVSFNSPLWKAIKKGAKEAGILDVLGEYKGNSMTMLGAGLEYSCAEQNWYQNLYEDIGLPDSPMQYLHVDEGDCLPKSMIYVTPVEEKNGPTHAIPGSNRWEISPCRMRMHKALDRVIGNRYAKYVHKAHYRPVARYVELRRIFMQLPKPFQGSSHFGDDILAGSDLAASLMEYEVPYLSKGGQAMVFDGPHLLHRGSMVKEGERLALQVIYRNQNDEIIKSHLSGESWFRDQIVLAKKYARKIVKRYA